MPNNLGNCVLARNSATPHLNPTITLSEMKLTIEPALASQAMKAISATSRAVPAASALNRLVSPPAILAQRRADEQGNGGGNRDGRMSRAAEKPEDQPAKQAGVKSRLGRQVGQRGVAQPGGQEIGRQRNTGNDVTAQPCLVIVAQPAESRQPPGKFRRLGRHVGHISISLARTSVSSKELRRRRRPSSSASAA